MPHSLVAISVGLHNDGADESLSHLFLCRHAFISATGLDVSRLTLVATREGGITLTAQPQPDSGGGGGGLSGGAIGGIVAAIIVAILALLREFVAFSTSISKHD